MGLKIVVAVTDGDWFNQLRRVPDLAEVNFWSPSPKPFRALQPGELFLFKLHAPINMIVGGGVYASSTIMPLSLAWEAFGKANGVSSLTECGRAFFVIGKWTRPPSGLSRSVAEF